jgi:hypothetical protein
VVPHVVHLGPELHFYAFRNRDGLDDGKIHIHEARAPEGIAAAVANFTRARESEAGDVLGREELDKFKSYRQGWFNAATGKRRLRL